MNVPRNKDHRSSVAASLAIAVSLVVGIAASAVIFDPKGRVFTSRPQSTDIAASVTTVVDVPAWAMVAIVAVVGILAAAIIFYLFQKFRVRRAEMQYAKEIQERELEAMGSALDRLRERMTLPSLVELNRLMLDRYHGIATEQANSSYISSKRAMWAGFAWLLICSLGGATIAATTGEKIIIVSLAAIGGGLAAFLSRTYIKVYERSLEQLNQYFSQPLLNSYYLTAERLISEMSAGERDGARHKLLDQLLNGSGAIISRNEASARRK